MQSPPENFENIFSAELEEIAKRQGKTSGNEVDRKELAGIALSGGGIRSATTSLGVLQALKKLGLLNVFDYLSTVSGGGFTGSWWSAWTSRDFQDGKDPQIPGDSNFFPPPELTQPERDAAAEAITTNSSNPVNVRRKLLDPVHHLRLFSNYLTPLKGPLSADTWRANAVISRNLVLTWLVLLPMIFAAVLVAQVYFTVPPKAETEFLYPYSHEAEDDALLQQIDVGMLLATQLDSMVHGSQKVSDIGPLRVIRNFNQNSSTGRIGEKAGPLIQLREHVSTLLTSADSAIQETGDTAMLPVLRNYLLSTETELAEWRSSDSVLKAVFAIVPNPSPADRVAEARVIRDTNLAYEQKLDPAVDSIRSLFAKLQDGMLDHREDVRDGWLFNGTHRSYLASRMVWASYLPVMLLAWIVVLVCLWMINSGDKLFGGNILQGSYAFIAGLFALNLFGWMVPSIFGPSGTPVWGLLTESIYEVVWAVGALLLLNGLLWDDAHWFWKSHRNSMNDGTVAELTKLVEARRAKIVTYHQRLLLVFFLLSVLLVFGGFGHEAINYLFLYHPLHGLDVWQVLARIAAVATIVTALTGTGLATRTANPNSDRGEPKRENKITKFLIGIAPPLILILLLCGVSWTSHWVLQDMVFRQSEVRGHRYILLVFAMWMLGFLSLYYAAFDLHFRSKKQDRGHDGRRLRRGLLIGIVVAQILIMVGALVSPTVAFKLPFYGIALPVATWVIIAWKYQREQKGTPVGDDPEFEESPSQPTVSREQKFFRMHRVLVGGTSTLLILGLSSLMLLLTAAFIDIAKLPIDHLFLVGLGSSLALLFIDLLWGVRIPEDGKRGNHEARVLLGINITMFSIFLLIPTHGVGANWMLTRALEVLLAVSFGLVIFVGWRIDPNALSIHAFYKQRIIRAYLGASNWLRKRSSVSDVHPEDDIILSKLRNCENGAPYHLINTTLNLLGTKTLETAQRHASNFIFSKRYCGSVTTGYRPTEEYMSGTMTLGTAVAISGAAASPNMGSNQVSGATTMLMSLLNVRLGYWAANPGQRRWKESQPKLWPYYLLRESLSQTSGFGAFCYLTDGGHFDNTGLYPLIERACRYIVLCDNGADPEAHFKDLGNALRRARIDFGVEFDLSGLKDMTSMTRRRTGSHWLRGTVRYSEEHVQLVWGESWDEGLSADERERYLTGTILILKPALVGDEPADVLQYGLAYPDFPQQSTANQWFSEDQFESYRRLGYWSVQTAFGKPDYSTRTRSEQLEAIAEWPAEMVTESASPMTDLAYGASLETV